MRIAVFIIQHCSALDGFLGYIERDVNDAFAIRWRTFHR